MSFFNLSSTDPEHYNRIKVKIPNTFSATEVQVAITTLTTNCNIEVLNENDYIMFLYDDQLYDITLQSYSKIDMTSLPYILQEAIDKKELDIQVSLTNLDTLRFVSKKEFAIVKMSYNARLVTGTYCSRFPISSQEVIEDEPIIIHEDKDIEKIVFTNLNLRLDDVRPVNFTTTPPNAYGYSIQYKIDNEKVATIDSAGYVCGLAVGRATITANVRNPKKSQISAPDFICKFSVEVLEPKSRVEIQSVSVPETIEIYEGEEHQVIPIVEPTYAAYFQDFWEQDEPKIATAYNGNIVGNKPGQTLVRYIIKNNLESGTQEITKVIKVVVKSATKQVKNHEIVVESVGYTLSTPVLYLLTNLGVPAFRNEIDNELKMQCGTISMILNNSFSSSFPIIAEQSAIVSTAPIGLATDFWIYLVDANMQEVKLLNPMYITIQMAAVPPQVETPGLIDTNKPQK